MNIRILLNVQLQGMGINKYGVTPHLVMLKRMLKENIKDYS